MKKFIVMLLSFSLLMSVFVSCTDDSDDDDADKDKEAIEEVVKEIETAVKDNNLDAFQLIADPDSELEFMPVDAWPEVVAHCGGSDFMLSGIEVDADAGTATATDQLDQKHEFIFVDSGDEWLLNRWEIDDIEKFYKKETL